jgi:hypothetical protein
MDRYIGTWAGSQVIRAMEWVSDSCDSHLLPTHCDQGPGNKNNNKQKTPAELNASVSTQDSYDYLIRTCKMYRVYVYNVMEWHIVGMYLVAVSSKA